MSQPPIPHRHPLGTTRALQNIIQSGVEQQFIQETRKLTIIYAKSKLEVDIPLNWTINKVKCMMSIHFVMLNFDKFEFQCNKFLISGKTLVSDLPKGDLIVTQADCQSSFDSYYQQNMKKALKKYNISTSNSLYPITHDAVSKAMKRNIPKERISNIEFLPENWRRQEQPQGMLIINFLRVIGIAFMVNLIFTFASYSQMAILVGVAFLYYLIDEYVKYNDRRRRQQEREAQAQQVNNRGREQQNQVNLNVNVNIQQPQQRNQQDIRQQNLQQKIKNFLEEPKQRQAKLNQHHLLNSQIEEESQKEIFLSQQQRKPQRKALKAKFTLWLAFTVQALYCYILSIFPNWTIQTHLHANQGKMDQIMNEIKTLDPEASDMIKKWQIKSYKNYQVQKQQGQRQKNE